MKSLILFLLLFTFICVPVSEILAQQVMLTPDSQVQDQEGKKITYDEFVQKMNTGQFNPVPVQDESGKHIGFRLAPRESSSAVGENSANRRRVQSKSTEIEGSEKLQFIYKDYLFAPVEFYNGETWTTKWMVFDTGTFIPVILLPEVAAEIGAIQKIKMGGVEVFNPQVGSYEFNDLVRNLNRYRERHPELFGDHEIAGIVGLPLLSNYLISIQAQTGEVTLRPMNSAQRTLYSKAPMAQAQYQSEQGNIWFPVTINGQKGFAHLDSGNPYFDVDSNIISKDQTMESFMVGETDLTEYLKMVEFRSDPLKSRYQGVGLDVISVFGNLAANPFVITIDPREQIIYFEKE